jgi:DNA-binding CsgD family transcriptional regulator
LKDDDIREIRKLKLTGITNKEIGKIYSVNRETIGYILRGKTWVHIK